jgi:hypothetical protein
VKRLAVVLCAATLALAACGKKPADVGPPPGSVPGLFPRTYPNPDRDPLLRDAPASPGERARP